MLSFMAASQIESQLYSTSNQDAAIPLLFVAVAPYAAVAIILKRNFTLLIKLVLVVKQRINGI